MRQANKFENWSLRWKFTGISIAVTFIALLLAATIFVATDYFNYKKDLISDALSETEITAQNSIAPLMFGDRTAALEVISAARLRPDVVRAVVLDASGEVFASFVREGAAKSFLVPRDASEGLLFPGGFLTVKKSLILDGKKVGSIFVEKDLAKFRRHEVEMFSVLAAVLIFALLAAMLISIRLQRLLTGPVSDLADVAQRISETRNYSIRAKDDRGDELGLLARVFNEMLYQIEKNASLLNDHAAMLEMQVKSRTEELSDANRKLVLELTERKRAENDLRLAQGNLRESEQRFRRLSDSTFEGIVIHDRGITLDVNQTLLQMTGYSREEIVGRDIIQLFIPAENGDFVRKKISELSEEAFVTNGKRKDGTIIPIEVRGTSIEFGGKPASVTAIRDVTEHKKNEAALISAKETAENATKLKDKFVGIVAHDLKSPLFGITGMLKFVLSDKNFHLEQGQINYLEMVLKACNEMLETVNNLLNINLLQTGRITPSKKRCSCRLLAEEKIGGQMRLAETKGISVRNDLSPNMRVLADPVLFGECITNLFSNAVKFCKIGGEITIFCPDGMPTTVAVRDNGVGISKKLIPNLFNPAVKTFEVGTAGERGTGLGLGYCKDLMLAHGGTITVESEVEKGSVFYLTLPDVKPVIMVVEDEPLVRQTTKELLGELDAEIIEAEDGLTALECLNERTPQVIITDIVMPRMDGFELIAKLKNSPGREHIPIIAATSSAKTPTKDGEDARSKALRLGADDFVNKPFVATDLALRVRRLLEI